MTQQFILSDSLLVVVLFTVEVACFQLILAGCIRSFQTTTDVVEILCHSSFPGIVKSGCFFTIDSFKDSDKQTDYSNISVNINSLGLHIGVGFLHRGSFLILHFSDNPIAAGWQGRSCNGKDREWKDSSVSDPNV